MKVYPVIHINDTETAVRQGGLALDRGAHGVYLIDHKSDDDGLLFETFNRLTDTREEAFIGVNMLAYEPAFALRAIRRAVKRGGLSREPDALWTDDIIEGSNGTDTGETMRYKTEHDMRTRILGGVAFKYTATYTDNPDMAAFQAQTLEPFVDTVTTSGSGTGHAPSRAKIAAMKNEVSGDLAVASGIDAMNIVNYAGLVDEILVASSIETKPYSGILKPTSLDQLIAAARALA